MDDFTERIFLLKPLKLFDPIAYYLSYCNQKNPELFIRESVVIKKCYDLKQKLPRHCQHIFHYL
jgi:hypothetical protein